MKRIVITGLGLVSPLGCDVQRFWDRISSGASGIGPITRFDCAEYDSRIAGEVKEFDVDAFIPKKEQRRMDEYTHYAMAAAELAVRDSGLTAEALNSDRTGVIVGSGVGGLRTLEIQHTVLLEKGPSRFSPFMIPEMISNIAAGLIAIKYGCRGPNYAVVSACATAAHSMGDGLRSIQRGETDIIISGGAESPVVQLGVGGFCAMKALSTRNDEPQKASRPFDAERDGFVIAEGAGILILEELEHARKRGASIYCEFAGFGMTCDAYHMTAPVESGEGAARAMKLAMADAGVGPDGIDYINAHGTSTQLNDKTETKAIKTALGEDRARQVAISSSKSMTGHMLGAAAGVESAVCALAMRHGVAPPTINQEHPDPECDLDYVPNTARELNIRACLNNSLGFGGHNASLLFRRV